MPKTPLFASRIITLAVPALLMASGALAQSSSGGSAASGTAASGGPATTGMAPPPQGAPQAPVGHRQPKLSDLPAESQNAATTTERSARDRELDRKLQICRGC